VLQLMASVLEATSQIAVATGIVNIWMHPADRVSPAHTELVGRHPNRWFLGLGNGPRSPL